MSEYHKKYKAKGGGLSHLINKPTHHLKGPKGGHIDASNWLPNTPQQAEENMQRSYSPNPRAVYKRGGKAIGGVHGEQSHHRADRARKVAPGVKQVIKDMVHKHEKHEHPGEPLTKLKKGGSVRCARKDGGRTPKGKTHINILIGSPKGEGQQQDQMPMPQQPVRSIPVPPPAAPGASPMPPAGGMPMVGGPQGAPPVPMPIPRKMGGRIPMTAGSESGVGRLEKARYY